MKPMQRKTTKRRPSKVGALPNDPGLLREVREVATLREPERLEFAALTESAEAFAAGASFDYPDAPLDEILLRFVAFHVGARGRAATPDAG